MNYKLLLGLFAKPIGAMVNNALAAGSVAVIAWAGAHGFSDGWVASAVAGVTLSISQAISGLAATQGVQIPVINKDQTNGVVVVPATGANVSQAVNGPKA